MESSAPTKQHSEKDLTFVMTDLPSGYHPSISFIRSNYETMAFTFWMINKEKLGLEDCTTVVLMPVAVFKRNCVQVSFLSPGRPGTGGQWVVDKPGFMGKSQWVGPTLGIPAWGRTYLLLDERPRPAEPPQARQPEKKEKTEKQAEKPKRKEEGKKKKSMLSFR